jgi:hypothetical protein
MSECDGLERYRIWIVIIGSIAVTIFSFAVISLLEGYI